MKDTVIPDKMPPVAPGLLYRTGARRSLRSPALLDQVARLESYGWNIELWLQIDDDPLTTAYNDASKLICFLRARRHGISHRTIAAYVGATPTPRVDLAGRALVVPEKAAPLGADGVEYTVHDGRLESPTVDSVETGFLILGAHLERLINAVALVERPLAASRCL